MRATRALSRACATVARSAFVARSAVIGPGCSVAENAVVHEGAVVGGGTRVEANAVVGEHVNIGEQAVIGAGATLKHCSVGSRTLIRAGVRIGEDGFGFVLDEHGTGLHTKKPQTKRVVVGSDVEIGANSCIDRGSWRDTIVGDGVKIDNLVQIGHNVVIGDHCIIASLSGIGGSATLGRRVYIGAMSGVLQWTRLDDGARVAARSGVMTDIPQGATYGGTPACPIRDYHKQTIALRKVASQSTRATGD